MSGFSVVPIERRSTSVSSLFGISVQYPFVAIASLALFFLTVYMLVCLWSVQIHAGKSELCIEDYVPTWIVIGPGWRVTVFSALTLWRLPFVAVFLSIRIFLEQSLVKSLILGFAVALIGLLCQAKGRWLFPSKNKDHRDTPIRRLLDKLFKR